jgi:molybdopterin-binding protein
MKRLHEETGTTILHVTHDRAEAAALGGRVAIIRDGRIVQVGADWSVFSEPITHFVAEFTGGRNIYAGEARVRGDECEFTAGSLKIVSVRKMTGPCHALVRPESVIVSREAIRTSARNQFRCVAESVVRLGDVCEVTAQLGEHRMTSLVTPRSVEDLEIRPGTPLHFSFKASSVHLFQEEPAEV